MCKLYTHHLEFTDGRENQLKSIFLPYIFFCAKKEKMMSTFYQHFKHYIPLLTCVHIQFTRNRVNYSHLMAFLCKFAHVCELLEPKCRKNVLYGLLVSNYLNSVIVTFSTLVFYKCTFLCKKVLMFVYSKRVLYQTLG